MDKAIIIIFKRRCDELAVMASMQKNTSIDAFFERRKLKYCDILRV
jgi:hypothetical protein